MIKRKIHILQVKHVTKLLFFLFFFLVSHINTAQTDRKIERWFGEARLHYSLQSYNMAIDICQRIIERDSNYLDARLLLADIYKELKLPEKEIVQLKEAEKKADIALISLRLGNTYYSLGNYEKALTHFLNYLNRTDPDIKRDDELNRKIKSCRFALEAIANPVEFNPTRLPDSVNSPYDEYWPSLSIDQRELVITRLIKNKGQRPQEDFYISIKGKDGWGKAQPVSEINTIDNEGAQSLSIDGKMLFFTACNRANGMGSCDIYYSIRQNSNWSTPVCASAPLNTNSWESQPSLSSDGRFLYFSSNRSGGKGGKDLWRSECLGYDHNGILKWKEPVNLGDSINTPGDEISPFIHAGNKNFYFSSNHHTGMGGFDLLMSEIINDSIFSAPVNLGYPVNTVNNEQGLHISSDGLTAFFSSSRNESADMDIYSFHLDESVRPHPATYVRIKVNDAQTLEPIEANLELTNLTSKDIKYVNKTTDESGLALLCLPTGSKYAFSVSKDGYLFYSESFDLSMIKHIHDPYNLIISLKPVQEGAEINLYNIYFETDSFSILPESEPELLKLTEFLKNNPGLNVEIQGHTDNTGTEERNLILSKLRAKSVVDYLIAREINKSRLSWAGYGENKPVADNNTIEGRRLNRRTTIKITDK
jgi:outer membrane protein OmpA-like peptidoglycan-associated protein